MKKSNLLAVLWMIALSSLPLNTAHAISLGGLSKESGAIFERVAVPTAAPFAQMMLCAHMPIECKGSSFQIVGRDYAQDYAKDYKLASKLRYFDNQVNSFIGPVEDRSMTWAATANVTNKPGFEFKYLDF